MGAIHRLPILYDIPKDVQIINAFHDRAGKFVNPYFEFIDICLDNLTFAAHALLQWQDKPLRLAPFQSVILETLWNKTFPILLASRGAGKTFMLAVYAALRAMLTPGSKVVIVAASFRQSKLVFEYIERLYEYSPLFRACCPRGIKKPSDSVFLDVGTSVIRALPLGNGEKIRGIRACVAADTLIDTDSGLIEISDIVNNEMDVSIFNGEKYVDPKSYVRTCLTDVHKARLMYGYEIEFSDLHRIMSIDGWKDIESLRVKDKIPVICNPKFTDVEVKTKPRHVSGAKLLDFKIPDTLNLDVAKVLGYLVSEGSVNSSSKMSVRSTDKELIDDYCAAFTRAFCVTPKVREDAAKVDPRGWNCKKSYLAEISRIGIREYLSSIGLKRAKAAKKSIPSGILKSPKRVVTSFLSALFEGDGTAVTFRDKRRDSDEFYIAYYSSSKKLCRQLQTLLLKYGLFGTLGERASKLSDKPQMHLRYNGQYARGFAEQIGFTCRTKMQKCKVGILMSKEFVFKKQRSLSVKQIDKAIRRDYLYDFYIPDGNRFLGNGIINHNTHIITDEFASINPEIFQVVVRGFASVNASPIEAATQTHLERQAIKAGKMTVDDMTKVQGNQIVYSGTANYQFNHFYKTFMTHKAIIDNKICGKSDEVNRQLGLDEDEALGDGYLDYKDYGIIKIPYQGLPESYMDEKQISQARVTMPKALFQMEYECKFPTDSDGFFKRSSINSSTPGHRACGGKAFGVETVGTPGYQYVMGIDPARKTDNFAISILKILPHNETYRNVYSWSQRGKSYTKAARKIRELLVSFNIMRIAMDAGGGGNAIMDILQDGKFLEPGEMPIWLYDDDDQQRFAGEHILDMVDFSPRWIRDANYGLASDIEHKRLLFPYRALELESPDYDENDDAKDEIWAEIDEQIKEACMIVVTPTKTGVQHFDIPELPASQQGTLKTYQRKDRYSALLLAGYAARTYLQQGQRTVTPNMGGWANNL